MHDFLYIILNGLLTGLIYGQMALGLSLVYGVMRIVNFAHGEFIAFGMLFLCFTQMCMNLSLWVSLPLLFCIYFLCFYIFYVFVLEKITHTKETTQFITMAAISMVIMNINLMLFKANTYSLSVLNNLGIVDFFGVSLQVKRIIAALLSLTSAALLFVFLKYSLIGKGIRAIVLNRKKAMYMGLPIQKLFVLCFLILSVLLCVSAISLLLIMDMSVQNSSDITLLCFVIVILGGLGHIHGTILSGILIGFIETMVIYYGSPLYKSVISFILLILILFFKPQGIFGRKNA